MTDDMKNALLLVIVSITLAIQTTQLLLHTCPTQAPDTLQAVVIEKRVPMSIRELQTFLDEAGH